jgi:hypothetical protein
MASSPRTQEREEERRLNPRTLCIASAGSACAAAVTSQLWIAGTWIAAALTPVIVTVVSELLSRPTERIARALTNNTAAVPDPDAPTPRPRASRPARRSSAGRPPRQPPAGPEISPDPDAPRPGAAGPVRVYRQPPRRPPRRRIAYGVVAATAGVAFLVGIFVFTTTELLAGESIGKSGGRTTLFSDSSNTRTTETEQERTTPTETDQQRDEEQQPSTEEQPAPTTETAPEATTTAPEPTQQPRTAEPPASTAPSETTPAP